MADVLIRNVDAAVLDGIKSAARRHQRSLQAELHVILGRASQLNLAETQALSRQWLRRLARAPQPRSDSAEMIRADRER